MIKRTLAPNTTRTDSQGCEDYLIDRILSLDDVLEATIFGDLGLMRMVRWSTLTNCLGVNHYCSLIGLNDKIRFKKTRVRAEVWLFKGVAPLV
ncbi:hypothetical protein PV327_009999 [Microctonus hyperodae]|uniref:Uncharacterized protein n=1 Tax=Microctonus hyperodae TaxID=165561 RepID=A0AA39F249_MICHY|nr:hypothetical protein PV327_009999 [Microctonus hyperodae]